MADNVINLRQARKAKARADKDKTAAENRRRHGLTKAEKAAEKKERQTSETHLDGHKRET